MLAITPILLLSVPKAAGSTAANIAMHKGNTIRKISAFTATSSYTVNDYLLLDDLILLSADAPGKN
jgi:hypothetical protein